MSTTETEAATETEATTTTEVEQEQQQEQATKPTETVDFWKTKAREQEKRAKANAEAAKRLQEIEDSGKSEAEKLTTRAETAEQSLTGLQTENAALQAENTILRHATRAGGNPDTLLDSRRFTDSLTAVDLADEKAVTDHIKAFVRDNPAYALAGGTPGSRDAGAGHGQQPAALDSIPAGTPRMAAAFEQEMASRTHRK